MQCNSNLYYFLFSHLLFFCIYKDKDVLLVALRVTLLTQMGKVSRSIPTYIHHRFNLDK